MLGWTQPFRDKNTIEMADAEEAKALQRFEQLRSRNRDLNNVIAQAARVAESVARLGEELRNRS